MRNLRLENFNKLVTLIVFWIFINKFPNLKKYSKETKFSVYRSIICNFLFLYAVENSISFFKEGITRPIKYQFNHTDLAEWFVIYLVFDLILMILTKNKRIDLYLHHIWSLLSFLIGFHYQRIGYIHSLLLITEIMSSVSGLDSMAREDDNNLDSLKYKKFRKSIIRYVRLPLWILTLIFTIKVSNKIPKVGWWNAILTSFIMISLDNYWERKCDKVINKYEKI